MDFTIPDRIEFYTEEVRNKKMVWAIYCFPHAVLRALEGERIQVKLTDDIVWSCDDCQAFGPPQPHELGSLRVSKDLKEHRR